ncbi:MAG: alanine racemase [Pseudomonadota bacterium]
MSSSVGYDSAAPRTLRLRIDTAALAENWRTLDRLSRSAKAGAAIKADCYGLGVATCLPVLLNAGADHFFVAHWSEVAEASGYVEPSQLSVLHGPVTEEQARFAQICGAVPVINSIEQAKIWREAGGGRCQLMVDTGINRLGVRLQDLADPAIQALDVDVLMSHLACADEDSPMNARQLHAFKTALGAVRHKSASLANSAGIVIGPEYHRDLTRPGLALYGGIPRPELADVIRQVAFPEVMAIQTHELTAGDTVGYNAEFTAVRDMRVATVSLGYADGFLRSWNDEGWLEFGGQKLALLGKISMDMVVVDCTEAPDLSAGDWLNVPYFLPDAAQQSTLSQYELLTVLGQRFG